MINGGLGMLFGGDPTRGGGDRVWGRGRGGVGGVDSGGRVCEGEGEGKGGGGTGGGGGDGGGV
jgi:hypothetical protein